MPSIITDNFSLIDFIAINYAKKNANVSFSLAFLYFIDKIT